MRFLDKLEEYAIIILMLAITLVTFFNVVARISGGNILWAKELTQNLFAWLVIFGASYCVRESSHIGIDAFTKKLKPLIQHKIGILAISISIGYALLLLIGGVITFYDEYLLDIEMEDMPIKEWIFKSILPIGFSLFLFRCTQILLDIRSGKKDTMGFNDEAKEILEETQEK